MMLRDFPMENGVPDIGILSLESSVPKPKLKSTWAMEELGPEIQEFFGDDVSRMRIRHGNLHVMWIPVKRHCVQVLGERFRFFHVMGIEGAKAGALNWVHQYIDDDVELVGLIDADYVVRNDWLRKLMPFFRTNQRSLQLVGFSTD